MSVRSKPNREVGAPAEPDVDSCELPEGWARARLGELVGRDGIFTDGDWILSEHLKTGTDVRLIQLADVGVLHFVDKSSKFISSETAESLRVTFLHENDVLISRMAHPLARACLVPKPKQPAITAVDVAVARCDGTVALPKYLMFVCNSNDVLNQAEEVAVGTTRKRISRKNLEQVSVPLPPLAEQRRIVGKLELLLGKVSSSQQRLSRVPGLLKRFRQSVLAAACSGKLTADWRGDIAPIYPVSPVTIGKPDIVEYSPGWDSVLLSRVATLESGHTPRKTLPEYWENGDVPWISLQDIRDANGKEIFNTKLMPTMLGIDNSSARLLPKGTVVFSRDISVGYVTIMGREMATTQHFANWICSERIYNRYLMIALMASRDSLVSMGQGSTVGTIYMPALKEFCVLLPPLDEQQEIVRRVEKLFAFADQIESRLRQAQAHVDRLTQSLLAKALRGELVPTEHSLATREARPYESATELLARIQGERRSKTEQSPKNRKRHSVQK